MKTIDEIAQEHIESARAYNPEPTWNLVHTAVCYGAQIGAERAEKELMGRIAYECGIEPTMDGNQVSLLIGENLQEGVCGFGNTEIDALVELLKDVKTYFAKKATLDEERAKVEKMIKGAYSTARDERKADS